jgi:ABC-type nickel/cobalt efflux system permease component RcnA
MGLRYFIAFAVVCMASAPAFAHPLPNFRYDRRIDVRLTPQVVEVRYVLEVSFWTIFADGRKLFTAEEFGEINGRLREVTKRYCERVGPLIAKGIEAKHDNRLLEFRVTKLEIEQDRDHARFRYVFQAPWKLTGGETENRFEFNDKYFEAENGAVWLTLKADEKVLVLRDVVEPEDLRGKQPSELKPGDADRARRTSATFTAPDYVPPKVAAPEPETTPTATVEEKPEESFFRAVLTRGPKALFDTNYGVGMLLLTAMIFGAFHAFAPGHGKSVAAAFLVGEQGTFRQAILLALSTTFAHTGSVILLAGVFYLRYREAVPQDAQHWLGLFGGLLVLFVGMWLFMRRLRGQVDHVHLLGGCADMCGNHAPAPKIPECRQPPRDAEPVVQEPLQLGVIPQKSPLSWVRVVLLGIGAGAIPCVDAVLLLLLAISAGRLAFALPLLVAFSVGLSAVLAIVGMLVVALHRAGRNVSGDKSWFRLLPTMSAVLLMAMGLWMARDAWKAFNANNTQAVSSSRTLGSFHANR